MRKLMLASAVALAMMGTSAARAGDGGMVVTDGHLAHFHSALNLRPDQEHHWAQIVATVISPHRFRTRRQFWSYCGLAIVTRSSSDWVKTSDGCWARRPVAQTRGLNRNRQPLLKNVFKGAAQTVLHMPDHPLKIAYDRTTAAGTKPNLAQLTLARRIAGAVLAMWKNKEKYNPAKPQSQP